MEIKKGYKMTDVGVIPWDWEVKSIGEIAKTTSGGTPSREDDSLYIGKNRWFTTSELNDGYIYDSIEHISDEAIKITTARIVPANSILMAMYGATIGKLAIITKESSTNQACCAIMVNSDIVMKYVFYNLLFLRQNIIELGVGAGQPNISQSIVRSIHLSIPSKKEQQAIADALTKVDNLIMSSSKVIEKKKLIKKGTMQKLLSGEMRLDGFEGEWELKKIKDIAVIEKGELLISSQYENGNIEVWAGGKVPAGFHNVANRTKNTITISASGAYAGFVSYHDCPIYATDCSTISESDDIYIKYLYYSLINIQDKIYDMQTGGAQPHVHAKDIYPIELTMPPSRAEQTAIANILTTMDNEIEALEKERDKYKCIKQGMMQQLLTGKIRLTCQ